MKFLDAAYPQSVPAFVSVLQQEQAQGFAYYIGGNYALNAWRSADVIGVRDSGFESMGIYVSTVAGRDPIADGQEAVVLHAIYGQDRYCCWDLEPGIYRQDPQGALRYGIAWAQAVRQGGLLPVLYSTPDGCAAIGDKGFEAVWAAVPGNCDPATVFAPSFFPGQVAVQCGQTVTNGIDYDFNISQFDFGVLSGSTGGSEVLDPADPIVQQLLDGYNKTNQLWSEFVKNVNERGTGNTGDVLIQIRDGVAALQKAGCALTPQQTQLLQDTHDIALRLETALKGA